MSTILVTGSAGFIGFHTAKRLLKDGHAVIGIDNLNAYYDTSLKIARNKQLLADKKYHFYRGNISHPRLLKQIFSEWNIDKICHLAAQAGVRYSLTHPLLYEKSNILGFARILECARQYHVKTLVFASSSSVYGSAKLPKTGFREDMPVATPVSFYGATKIAGESMAYSYHHLYGLQCTGLRFFTVYGPWGRPDMAYMKFARDILAGNPISLYDPDHTQRDFTYADDAVNAIVSALDKSYGYELFNIGNSKPVNLYGFVKLIEQALGRKAVYQLLPPQPGDVPETKADISKARRMLGFRPKTPLREGIGEFVKWYKEYYSSPKK